MIMHFRVLHLCMVGTLVATSSAQAAMNAMGKPSQCTAESFTWDPHAACEAGHKDRCSETDSCLPCAWCDGSDAKAGVCPECCLNEDFQQNHEVDASCKGPELPGGGQTQHIGSHHCRQHCKCYASSANNAKGYFPSTFSSSQKKAGIGDTSCMCYDSECYCGGNSNGEQVPNCGCIDGWGGDTCDAQGGPPPQSQVPPAGTRTTAAVAPSGGNDDDDSSSNNNSNNDDDDRAPGLPGGGQPQHIGSHHCRQHCKCYASAANDQKGYFPSTYSKSEKKAGIGDTSCMCYDSECYCGGTSGLQVPNCGCIAGWGDETCNTQGGPPPQSQRCPSETSEPCTEPYPAPCAVFPGCKTLLEKFPVCFDIAIIDAFKDTEPPTKTLLDYWFNYCWLPYAMALGSGFGFIILLCICCCCCCECCCCCKGWRNCCKGPDAGNGKRFNSQRTHNRLFIGNDEDDSLLTNGYPRDDV